MICPNCGNQCVTDFDLEWVCKDCLWHEGDTDDLIVDGSIETVEPFVFDEDLEDE